MIQTVLEFIVGQKMRIGWLVSVQLQVIIEKKNVCFSGLGRVCGVC